MRKGRENSAIIIGYRPSVESSIESFLHWYYKNEVKGEKSEVTRLRNFIEKMAVWYELRYPYYEVAKIIPWGVMIDKSVDEEMFKNNPYVKEILGEVEPPENMEWSKFYNFEAFYRSLPADERIFFRRYCSEILYYDLEHRFAHLHLDRNGCVYDAEGFEVISVDRRHPVVKNEQLIGLHLKDVYKLLLELGVTFPENSEIANEVKAMEQFEYFKKRLLDSVMRRIIVRGGNRVGPRRALMFAKEFGCNASIPLKYGIDVTDPYLREFMNKCIMAGANPDTECFLTESDSKSKVSIIRSARSLLGRVNSDYKSHYTEEEAKLGQDLVNILNSDKVRQDVYKNEVKRLRIERKLEHSRRNSQH